MLWIKNVHGFSGCPAKEFCGDLFVRDGRYVAPTSVTDKHRADATIIDAEGCVVLPGLVVSHHHLYSALARGMTGALTPPADFVEVLKKVWWRLDRALDTETTLVSAMVGAAEAALCGVTVVVDHHASPKAIEGSLDAIADGLAEVGLRGVLCYECSDRNGPANFEAGLAENERFLETCATKLGGTLQGAARVGTPLEGGSDPWVRGMVGGHAPFTLSDEHLRKLADLGKKFKAAVHIHVAESTTDQEDARKRGATNVTERLEAAGLLEGKLVAAHGVHLRPVELSRLKDANAWLTHQPRSNLNNHVGYLSHARSFGKRLALGTDGINSDILAEAQAAFFRLREHDRHASAESVWSWLAAGWQLANSAWGLEPATGFGTFAVGAPGDLVVLDYDAPSPVHAGNLAWHLAFGLGSRHVRDTVVKGRVVVRHRELQIMDGDALRERANITAARLWERMGKIPEGE